MSRVRFIAPPPAGVAPPAGLAEAVKEAILMREMRLAELRSFVADLEEEHGPVAETEMQAIRDEWPGRG